MGDPVPSEDAILKRWERRIERERLARIQAEDLLEAKSRELYQANNELLLMASELEHRVDERTRELASAREDAVMLSERDQLTALPNRMLFVRTLDDAVARPSCDRPRFALLLIDADRFKDINDGLGHEAGDVFLQEMACRLRAVVGGADMVARLGGDEFAALITNFSSIEDLLLIADRMIADTRRPVAYADHFIESSCSIGIAVFPDDSRDGRELQRYADLALYRAKAAGRATSVLFDRTMRTQYEARRALGADLKMAIRDREITPWFQPIVDGTTGTMKGVEALARWMHPRRGLLSPDQFLKLAEERGLVNDLFTRMLSEACVPARRWLQSGDITYLAINVSPSQFRSHSPAEQILEMVRDIGFPPEALIVEITEDLLLFDLERAAAQLALLADGGVRIALDDFGMGYSNIGYLRRLPIHIIKLDRMLTADVSNDSKARSVIGAIVDIADALDLDLVAEGVEDQAQALWLARLGCRYQQGFFFGRPMPEMQFEAKRAHKIGTLMPHLAGDRQVVGA